VLSSGMTDDRHLQTPRLVMSPPGLEDFAGIARLWADAQVTRFIGGKPLSREDCWSRLLRARGHWDLFGYGYWTVRLKPGGRFVGEVGFGDFQRMIEPPFGGAPEMGWAFDPGVHGQGLAREAAQAAIDWAAARLGARLVCLIDPANIPSLRLAAKLGFAEYARTSYRGDPVVLLERITPPDPAP
jgi:RimJ/RimL family protein N-acetyltransferase